MPDKHRILVVDDHPVFREGLLRVLHKEKNLDVVGEAANATDALKAAASLRPHLVMVDISLENSNGIELTRSLREKFADIRILMLSMHKESLHAERALRAGANGYIMKSESGKHLIEAVQQVLSGKTYVSEAMNERLLQKLSGSTDVESHSPLELLSEREFEIFELIGQGYGTRQIADQLHVSIKTVESHREHIREKMQIPSTFELVQRAIHWTHSEKEST